MRGDEVKYYDLFAKYHNIVWRQHKDYKKEVARLERENSSLENKIVESKITTNNLRKFQASNLIDLSREVKATNLNKRKKEVYYSTRIDFKSNSIIVKIEDFKLTVA